MTIRSGTRNRGLSTVGAILVLAVALASITIASLAMSGGLGVGEAEPDGITVDETDEGLSIAANGLTPDETAYVDAGDEMIPLSNNETVVVPDDGDVTVYITSGEDGKVDARYSP